MLLGRAADPPFVVPYCQFCQLPVERFAYVNARPLHERLVLGEPRSSYYIELEASCCGKTQGKRISRDELLRIKRSKEKLFLVVKRGRYQGFGELRRAF